MRGQGTPLNCLLALDFIDSAFLCHSLLKVRALEAQMVEKGTSRIRGTRQNALHGDTLVNTFYYKSKGCSPTANGNCSQVLP